MQTIIIDSENKDMIAEAAKALSEGQVVAIPTETVMIPLLCNDLFGAVSYDKFLGVFMAMKALGLCLGAPLGDLYFDMFGTYRPCFWFFAIIMAAVGIGYMPVIRSVYKEKAAIIAAQEVSQ